MVHRLVVVGSLCVNVCVWSSEWVVLELAAVALLFLLVVFLWWSEVSLCACCLVDWGAGLFCAVGGPLLVEGCLGLDLWRFPLVNGLGGDFG